MQTEKSTNLISIKIIATLNHAFRKIKGCKGAIWSAVLIIVLISILINLITFTLFGIDERNVPYWMRYILVPIITNAIIAPFYAGAVMCAIKHIRGEKISVTCGFQYFKHYIHLAIAMIIIGFIASIGMMIINMPTVVNALSADKGGYELLASLYSVIIYALFILTIPLIADHKKQALSAMQASIRMVLPHLLKIFIIIFISYLLILIISIPIFMSLIYSNPTLLAIGTIILIAASIWFIPWIFTIQGSIYYQLVDKKNIIDQARQ